MWKKTLMAAAFAAGTTVGAMSAAQAGELKIRLNDVNIQCYEAPSETRHIDWDCYDLDKNEMEAPGVPFNVRSIDNGFIGIFKPEFNLTFYHVAVADERNITPLTPASGLYEVELFEIGGASTLTPTLLVEINLSGSGNPMFKEDQNCADTLRAGGDGVFSKSASGPISDPDHGIQFNKTRAVCLVNPQLDKTFLDRSIGFALPINTKACGDLVISFTVTRISDGFNQGSETSSHLFQECKDSIHSSSGYYPVKIDYFADFRSFLVDPNPHDEEEIHEPSLWAETGALDIDIWHYLTDLKESPSNKDSEEHVFDVSDIVEYQLMVSFADLTGIKEFKLGGVPGTLDRVNDTVSWVFNNAAFKSLFCLETWTYDNQGKGGESDGCSQAFTIHAFGPHDDNIYNGPIDHQEAVITKSRLILTSGETNAQHPVPFFPSEDEQLGAIVAHLLKTGIQFGPFDWATNAGRQVVSVFRVTGIPKDIGDLKGDVLLENVSGGEQFKGLWKVDYPDNAITGHDLIISPALLQNMLLDAGMPDNAEWGRADLTFTFYVGGKEGIKMDMDRLLASNGVWADYGDNGNDSNSLKARSCDDGRFGPHVANKLDPRFKHLLVGICNLGELSRYGIYVQ